MRKYYEGMFALSKLKRAGIQKVFGLGLALLLAGTTFSQVLSESFNSTTMPAGWTNVYGTGTTNWTTVTTNQNSTVAPHSGARMAEFRKTDWTSSTKLVTPALDLSAVVAPQLDFYYANAPWGTDVDALRVYYKTSAAGAWVQIGPVYSTGTAIWQHLVVALPSPSADYYVAFEGTSSYARGLNIDDVIIGAAPTCPPVTALTASNPTTTGISLGWTNGGAETAWSIEYGPAGFTQGTGTVVPATSNPFTLSGLTSSTNYSYYVRANCGTGDLSTWSPAGTFATACSAVTAFTQNFDGVAASTFPICWGKVGTPGTANLQATSPASTPNTLYMYSSSGTNLAVVRMQPVSNLGAGTHRLKFNMRANLTAGGIVEVGYLTNASDASTFVSLGTATAAGLTYAEYTVTPAAGTYTENLAFRAGGTPANSILIDDVKWEAIPSCEAVTALTSSNPTTTGVSVGWTNAGTATAWNIEYGPAGFTQGTGTVVPATSNPFTLSGLTAATAYSFYVQSNCGGAGLSAWSATAGSFVTACAPVTAFTQNFDGVAASAFPVCWGKVGTTGTANLQTTTPASAPNTLYMYSSSATNRAVVKMQPVSNLGAGTHRLRFNMRTNSTVGGIVEVGYLTNATDASTFVSLGTATAATLTYAEYVVTPVAGTYTENLAFRVTGSPANSLLIDDVKWEALPSCPEVTGLNVQAVTSTSATIGWTNVGPATTWTIEYGPAGFTQGTGTVLPATSNPFTINGLTANTSYTYYVRANCGTGDVSTWTGPGSIYTGYCLFTGTTATRYINNFATTNGVTNITNNSSGFSAGGYNNATAMVVSQLAGSIINFTGTISGGTAGFNIWVDWNNNMVFEEAEKMYASGAYVSAPTGSFTVPPATALGNYRMRIVSDWGNINPVACGTSENGEVEDYTLSVVAPPTCPATTALVVSDATAHSVKVAWTNGGNETAWIIEYGPAGFTQGAGTTVPATSNPFTVTGLTPSTSYGFYVRANCGPGDLSTWIGPKLLSTLCDAPQAVSGGNVTICAAGPAELHASSPAGSYLKWYETATSTTLLDTGDVYTTPFINTLSATYYVAAASEGGGLASYSLANITPQRNYYNTTAGWGHNFTVTADCTIDSISVYPLGTGSITIQVLDATTNAVLYSGPATSITGTGYTGAPVRVPVGISLTSGNYKLGKTSSGITDMGSQEISTIGYPFTSPVLNITSGSQGTGIAANVFYWFYNWKVTEGGATCEGSRVPVTITLAQPSHAGNDGTLTVCRNQPFNLVSGLSGTVDLGGTWYGPNSAVVPGGNAIASNVAAQYDYKYIVNNGLCPNDTSKVIVNVQSCNYLGLDEISLDGFSLYPNPTEGLIYVSNSGSSEVFSYEVLDLNGRKIASKENAINGTAVTEINLNEMEAGIYMIHVFKGKAGKTFRVVVR